MQKLANFGTGEPWVARISLTIREIASHGLGLDEPKRTEFNDGWGHFDMKLGEAYAALVELRKVANDPDAALHDISRSYIGFYSLLWAAFKDRLPKALSILDYDIGFLFVKQSNFEAQFNTFCDEHSKLNKDGLATMIIDDKNGWQDKLAEYRNLFVEHHSDDSDDMGFHALVTAELMFENVWKCAEDWAIIIMKDLIRHPMIIAQIAKADRDPSRPEKYMLTIHPDVIQGLQNA